MSANLEFFDPRDVSGAYTDTRGAAGDRTKSNSQASLIHSFAPSDVHDTRSRAHAHHGGAFRQRLPLKNANYTPASSSGVSAGGRHSEN